MKRIVSKLSLVLAIIVIMTSAFAAGTMANTEQLIVGDINGDGKFTSADAVLWLYNDIFGKEYKRAQSADYNGDGVENGDDAGYLLFSCLFGQDVYPLPDKEAVLTVPDDRYKVIYSNNGIVSVKPMIAGDVLDVCDTITDNSGVQHNFVGWYNEAQTAYYTVAPDYDVTVYAVYKGYTKYTFDNGVVTAATTAEASDDVIKFNNGAALTPSLLDGIADRTYALTSGNTYVLAMKYLLGAGQSGEISVYGVKADGTAVQLDINEYTYDEVTVSGGKWSNSASVAASLKLVGAGNWSNTVFSITASQVYSSFYIKYTGESEFAIDDLTVSDNNINKNTVNGVDISEFRFVRPHFNSSYLTQIEMEKLCVTYGIAIADDNSISTIYEVIVGNSSRSGVETITDHDKFSIKISGTKVYINGGSPHAIAAGVTEFGKLLSKKNVTNADSFEGSYTQAISNYDKTTYYTHAWGDDFDGSEVDILKWNIVDGEKHYQSLDDGSSSWRVAEANIVQNGHLIQREWYEGNYKTDPANVKYYGGTLRSGSKMTFRGGYLEHSVIIPDNPVSWNTLWLSSVADNGIIFGEIDLNETFATAKYTSINVHTWPKKNNEYGWEHRSFDNESVGVNKKVSLSTIDSISHNLNTEFHTYGILWTRDALVYTFDGEVYINFDLNRTGFEDFKMAFSNDSQLYQVIIAASPGTTGEVSNLKDEHWTPAKSDYVTDYVHIYQVNDGWSVMNSAK